MSRSGALPRGMLVVTLGAFIALSLAALFAGTDGIDSTVRLRLLDRASANVMAVMRVVNVAGDWKFLLPATVLLIGAFDRARRTWWVWVALMIAAPLAEGLLKLAIGRARPESAAYGFPSGHATAAAAYFGAVLYLARDLRPTPRIVLRVVAVAMTLAVGVARIMLRAHWPSDVLGGLALGLALATIAVLVASGAGGHHAPRVAHHADR